jgi:tetratricopeptide (TPR) repeat protein
MKKIFTIVLIALITSIAFGQTKNRVSAKNYYDDKEYDLAKEAVDKCVVHPKTAKDPRAWLYYGQIYHAIALSKDKVYSKLDPNSEIKAYDGYKNAVLFNFKDPAMWNLDIDNNQLDMITFSKAIMDQNTKYVDKGIVMDVLMNYYPALSNSLVNKGLEEYKGKNFEKALNLFERSLFTSQMTGKVDTQAVYFCALASVKAEKTDDAIQYYSALNEMGYGETEVDKANNFYFLAKQYLVKNDTAKYVKTIEAGITKYPNSSSNLVVEMINYYMNKGQQKEALDYLDKGIAANPTNASLHYAKGTIYDTDEKLKNSELALESYKKTVEIDPTHFDAYYNMGAIYYNEGAQLNDSANAVDPDDFQTYNKIKKQADEEFKKALPYLEKAHELDPKDLPTMQSLKLIYYRTGNLEKSKEMKTKMGQ